MIPTLIHAALLLAPLQGAPAPAPSGDPTKNEVPLPACEGWNASLVLDNGSTGVWTVGGIKAFPQFGCPEVFGLDDKGHCILLFSYSGKWTPFQTVEDGEWLGALQVVDLDPRRPGEEIYTGGKKGNLFQIKAHREGGFDTNIIGRLPAQEIHTLASGDLRPSSPGNEMILYTLYGDVYEVKPKAEPGNAFELKHLQTVSGRVRQAIVLPAKKGEAPWILGACRSGEMLLHRLAVDKIEERVVLREPMGLGRMDLKRAAPGDPFVVYVSRDDGAILRVEQKSDGTFERELIYSGPQGPRGVAAGRFDADPNVETVAVFGYSKFVQLLSRRPGEAWTAVNVFEDRDKGHWLSTLEVDGRNATDELVGSGYGGRIFLLSRPPGYGIDKVPVEPVPVEPKKPEPAKKQAARDGGAPRVGVFADPNAVKSLSSLSYRGGFEAKTLVYETPFAVDADGNLTSALFESWEAQDGGRRWVFRLRPGLAFHDGTAVDAQAVAEHLRRVARMPEHQWISGTARMRDVRAAHRFELEVELDAPHALPPDLCAVNPLAVMAPTSRTPNGEFRWPVGSGAFRVVALPAAGDPTLRLSRAGAALGVASLGGAAHDIEVRCYAPFDREALYNALVAGEIDVAVDRDSPSVPRSRVKELTGDPRFRVLAAPGSAMRYLCFNLESGPAASADVRRRVASAIERGELCQAVEGLADPCDALFMPHTGWPARSSVKAPTAAASLPGLRFIVDEASNEHAALAVKLAGQLSRGGLDVQLTPLSGHELEEAVAKGRFDLRIGESWGMPYDPFITLGAEFRGPLARRTAVDGPPLVNRDVLDLLVAKAQAEPDSVKRLDAYKRIQQSVDENAWIVPLYAPRRVAVLRAELPEIPLTGSLYHLDLRPLVQRS